MIKNNSTQQSACCHAFAGLRSSNAIYFAQPGKFIKFEERTAASRGRWQQFTIPMKQIIIQILLTFMTHLSSNSQEFKIDTLDFDNNNIRFQEFSGTWYDNIWDNPVMRGYSLSRVRSDSSRFSLTFYLDGTISGLNFSDLSKTHDSTNWWYDGKFIYLKQFKDSIYTAYKIFKNQHGDIIIAVRPSGKLFFRNMP